MKAVLCLCLLAFIACEKNIIDIGKCIYKAPIVKEIINEAITAFITQDFSKLLDKIKESIPELIKVVLGCVIEQAPIEDAPKAEGWNFQCIYQCNHMYIPLPPDKLQECLDNCNGIYH